MIQGIFLSVFDLQDFYSNNLGQQFYDSNFYQETWIFSSLG